VASGREEELTVMDGEDRGLGSLATKQGGARSPLVGYFSLSLSRRERLVSWSILLMSTFSHHCPALSPVMFTPEFPEAP